MKCNELMSRSLKLVSVETSVLEASRLMRDSSIGVLPVCDADGRVVGVVTDRDIATRVVAENLGASDTQVGQIATKNLVVCLEGDDLSKAEESMRTFQKSRLIVVDSDGYPVGILSLADIINGDNRGRRALKTARAVIGRDAGGPHEPLEEIHLTASAPGDEEAVSGPAPNAQEEYESSRTARSRDSVFTGGGNRGMKEFP